MAENRSSPPPASETESGRSWLKRLECYFVGDATAYEVAVLRHGACWFFLILFGYYILRPIREQISATYGVKNLSWLFSVTFVTMLVAIPMYSVLVGKFHRRWLVPSIYGFFIASLLGFWAAMRFGPTNVQIWVARVLFVWISVYGLFIVSFFWSVVGDMLSTEQGRRIFGVMSGFGTLGGLVGSQVARWTVRSLGVANLLLIPMLSLIVGLIVYLSLEKTSTRMAAGPEFGSFRRQCHGRQSVRWLYGGIPVAISARDWILWVLSRYLRNYDLLPTGRNCARGIRSGRSQDRVLCRRQLLRFDIDARLSVFCRGVLDAQDWHRRHARGTSPGLHPRNHVLSDLTDDRCARSNLRNRSRRRIRHLQSHARSIVYFGGSRRTL